MILTTLFWAGNFVLGRAFSADIPPITMAAIRWVTALVIVLPFALPVLWQNRRVIIAHKWVLLALGILSVGCFNTLAYVGLQYTTAINGSLMQSTMPIMILCLCAVFLNEVASVKQWLGVLVSLLGVLVLMGKGELSNLLALTLNVGDVWVVSAMFLWAVYSVGLRWRPKELSAFAFFCVTLTVGVIFLIPLSLFEMQSAAPIIWDRDAYFLIAYLAVFPSILAHMFWNYGVAKIGPQKAGLFIHLVPFWGMALSVYFLGESIHAFHFVGITLIFAGIYLAVLSKAANNN